MSIRVLLVVDECVRRDVEEVGVGGEVREFFEWAFVWGDVDPHGGGLGACESRIKSREYILSLISPRSRLPGT
jgi:hypothetical protein